MSRLPLRLRLTLAFALAMALVLGAMALFVYVRVGNALLASVDQDLRAASTETRAQIREAGVGNQPLIDPDTAHGETLAQVLTGSGAVVRSTPTGLQPLIAPQAAARVEAGVPLLRTTELPGRPHHWRVLAVPVRNSGGVAVLVIAGSLESRQVALHRLLLEFAGCSADRPPPSLACRLRSCCGRPPASRVDAPPGSSDLGLDAGKASARTARA